MSNDEDSVEKLVGYISVDSGQVMVGDPCYLNDWKDTQSMSINHPFTPGENLEYSYYGACNASMGKKQVDVLENGLAIVSSSGYGDGRYAVYATYSDEGLWGWRVRQLRIVFIEDIQENEDDVLEICDYCHLSGHTIDNCEERPEDE